jgi:hypothetical protein
MEILNESGLISKGKYPVAGLQTRRHFHLLLIHIYSCLPIANGSHRQVQRDLEQCSNRRQISKLNKFVIMVHYL